MMIILVLCSLCYGLNDANLVAYYPMNDKADSNTVVNTIGVDGNSVRNTSLMHVAGKIGGALSFDGTSDYADTSQWWADIVPYSHSIGVWVKANDGQPASAQYIFGMQYIFGDDYPETDNRVIYFLRINTNGTLTLYWKGEIGAAAVASLTTSVVFLNGENDWKHIIVTVENLGEIEFGVFQVNVKIYANNVLVGSVSWDKNIDDWHPEANMFIGAYNEQQSYGGEPVVSGYFDGSLDDFRIFNKALTAAEVTWLYAQGYTRHWLDSGGWL